MAVDWVYRTAAVSTVAQIVLGGVSLIGFAKIDQGPRVLWVLLVLDVTVQIIELVFYMYFVCICRLATWYRYIDWFISTPIMLVSTMVFIEYINVPTLTLDRFAATYRNDVIFVVIMNALMLSFGLSQERRWIPKYPALLLGWIPFLLVFASMYARLAYKSVGTICLLTFVFITWALYGVAAFFSYVPKNVAYNLLDIVSKNFYGVVVSIYMLAT